MPVYHRTVSLATTTAVNLATVITDIGNTIKLLSFQAATNNTAVVYVGGKSSTLTSTDYAFIIPTPVTNVPAAPITLALADGLYNVADLQLLVGTTTQVVHLCIITN
jgi:hypothetical protein